MIACTMKNPLNNLTGAVAWRGQFSEGTLSPVIGAVNCSGEEDMITNCSHAAFPSCGRFSDAEVKCQGIITYCDVIHYNYFIMCSFS